MKDSLGKRLRVDQRLSAPPGCVGSGQDIRSFVSTAHVGDYVASGGKGVIDLTDGSEALAVALPGGHEWKRGRFFAMW